MDRTSDGKEHERRYAEDGKPYSLEEFKSYYGTQWAGRWEVAPARKEGGAVGTIDGEEAGSGRGGAPDGGSSAAEPASDGQEEERRYALNGEPYTSEESKRYYGAQWTDMWSTARGAGAAGPSEEAVGSLQGARAADGSAYSVIVDEELCLACKLTAFH